MPQQLADDNTTQNANGVSRQAEYVLVVEKIMEQLSKAFPRPIFFRRPFSLEFRTFTPMS